MNILLFLQEIQKLAKDYPLANVYVEDTDNRGRIYRINGLMIDTDGDIIIEPRA